MKKASIEDLEKELWLREREEKYWETKDGKRIPLKEMTTEHIMNAINYFDRVYDERQIAIENSDVILNF